MDRVLAGIIGGFFAAILIGGLSLAGGINLVPTMALSFAVWMAIIYSAMYD